MHEEDPNRTLYLPPAQCTHEAPFVPVYPALHSHVVFFILPAGEIESEGQSVHMSVDAFKIPEYFAAAHAMHAKDPLLDLYVPATHPVQTPPVPVHPALQIHAETAVLPAGENEFAGHAAQPPVSDPYVPAAQTQRSDTGTLETKSVPHNVHVKPFPRKPSLQVMHASMRISGSAGHPTFAIRHEH